MSDELLPCPFCNAPGYCVWEPYGFCIKCTDSECYGRTKLMEARHEAIKRWNRRAAPAAVEPAIGAIQRPPGPLETHFEDYVHPLATGILADPAAVEPSKERWACFPCRETGHLPNNDVCQKCNGKGWHGPEIAQRAATVAAEPTENERYVASLLPHTRGLDAPVARASEPRDALIKDIDEYIDDHYRVHGSGLTLSLLKRCRAALDAPAAVEPAIALAVHLGETYESTLRRGLENIAGSRWTDTASPQETARNSLAAADAIRAARPATTPTVEPAIAPTDDLPGMRADAERRRKLQTNRPAGPLTPEALTEWANKLTDDSVKCGEADAAALSPEQLEPAAWMYTHEGKCFAPVLNFTRYERPGDWTETPLYAAARAQQRPATTPTAEEVERIQRYMTSLADDLTSQGKHFDSRNVGYAINSIERLAAAQQERVPREPTHEMIQAGNAYRDKWSGWGFRGAWRAMYDAWDASQRGAEK